MTTVAHTLESDICARFDDIKFLAPYFLAQRGWSFNGRHWVCGDARADMITAVMIELRFKCGKTS